MNKGTLRLTEYTAKALALTFVLATTAFAQEPPPGAASLEKAFKCTFSRWARWRELVQPTSIDLKNSRSLKTVLNPSKECGGRIT